jgi:hypothetical protein
MKNLFLFVAIATLTVFSSCSSDSDEGNDNNEPTTFLKFTANGTEKTFTNIAVVPGEVNIDWVIYPVLTITAVNQNDANEYIIFSIKNDGSVGGNNNTFMDVFWTYTIFVNPSQAISHTWQPDECSNPNFISNIEVNNNTTKKVKGTFSGNVCRNTNPPFGPFETLNVTNGSFNISY